MVSVVGDIGMNTCQCLRGQCLGEGCERGRPLADRRPPTVELQCEAMRQGSQGGAQASSFHTFAAAAPSPAQLSRSKADRADVGSSTARSVGDLSALVGQDIAALPVSKPAALNRQSQPRLDVESLLAIDAAG